MSFLGLLFFSEDFVISDKGLGPRHTKSIGHSKLGRSYDLPKEKSVAGCLLK